MVACPDLPRHRGRVVRVQGQVATGRTASMADGRPVQFVTLQDAHGLADVTLFDGECTQTPYLTLRGRSDRTRLGCDVPRPTQTNIGGTTKEKQNGCDLNELRYSDGPFRSIFSYAARSRSIHETPRRVARVRHIPPGAVHLPLGVGNFLIAGRRELEKYEVDEHQSHDCEQAGENPEGKLLKVEASVGGRLR